MVVKFISETPVQIKKVLKNIQGLDWTYLCDIISYKLYRKFMINLNNYNLKKRYNIFLINLNNNN